MTEMTLQEFMESQKKFLNHPILVEQEAMIVAALAEGKITKKTAGDLMIKVARHNIAKLKELYELDVETLLKEYGNDS